MERRQHERFAPEQTINVANALSGELVGTVINISEGGFLLATNQVTQDQATFQFRVQSENGDLDISPGARCLWHAKSNTEGFYWAGFQIIDISEDAAQALRTFLAGMATAK